MTGPRSRRRRWLFFFFFLSCQLSIPNQTGYIRGVQYGNRVCIWMFLVRYIVTGCIFRAPERNMTGSGFDPPPPQRHPPLSSWEVECPPPPPRTHNTCTDCVNKKQSVRWTERWQRACSTCDVIQIRLLFSANFSHSKTHSFADF